VVQQLHLQLWKSKERCAYATYELNKKLIKKKKKKEEEERRKKKQDENIMVCPIT